MGRYSITLSRGCGTICTNVIDVCKTTDGENTHSIVSTACFNLTSIIAISAFFTACCNNLKKMYNNLKAYQSNYCFYQEDQKKLVKKNAVTKNPSEKH